MKLADHEKAEWHALFEEVFEMLTNLNVKLPILTLGIPEDAARAMTLGVSTYVYSWMRTDMTRFRF